MDVVDKFYKEAVEFCQYIENRVITQDSVAELLEMLMTLYIDGLHLPDMEPDLVDDGTDKTIENVKLKMEIPDYYQELFNPLEDEEIVGCDLYDDFLDIRKDLLKGINEYDAGYKGNAIFEWKLGLNEHWGKHATDAMRALHSIRTR